MKIAIVGAWHVHAGDYIEAAKRHGEVVGVYEENPAWRAEFARKHAIPEFESYEALLASDAEAVIVTTATDRHPEVIVRAAEAGKHIFTEKVLALDVAGCEAIRAAVEKSGVRFMISFPWKCNPGILAVKQAVDAGLVGRVNYVRFRNCHSGSRDHWLPAHFYDRSACGGGAMIDLGAHGMYLAHWILGEPERYASAFRHFCRDEEDAHLNRDGVEDNAVTVMSYPDGAIAINETGFVSVGSPAVFEVGGEDGYLRFDGKAAILSDKQGSRALELSEWRGRPIDYFSKGEPLAGCGLEEACALTRMMVGAYANA